MQHQPLITARDPFFGSRPGLSPPSQLGKALRKRKIPSSEAIDPSSSTSEPNVLDPNGPLPGPTPSSSSVYASNQDSSELFGLNGDVARRIRMRVPDMEEVDARPAVVETDTADTERNEQDLRGSRRVEVEKSNVLMM